MTRATPKPPTESVRQKSVRPKTLDMRRVSLRVLNEWRAAFPDTNHQRPKTRGECKTGFNVMRPCPYVGCKHHLYLDVSEETGSIKFNFPDKEPWELEQTCSLDIADRGGMPFEDIGQAIGVVKEVPHRMTGELCKLLAGDSRVIEAAIDMGIGTYREET